MAMKDKGGANIMSGHVTVAPDGKTMSVETTAGSPGTDHERSKAVYGKQ